jgi:hypothetical protein
MSETSCWQNSASLHSLDLLGVREIAAGLGEWSRSSGPYLICELNHTSAATRNIQWPYRAYKLSLWGSSLRLYRRHASTWFGIPAYWHPPQVGERSPFHPN